MESTEGAAFPFEIRDLDPEVTGEIMKLFTEYVGVPVQIGPKKYMMPRPYKEEASLIYNMKIRPSDVFITGFPRSGTTWTRELVWLVANDLDYGRAAAVELNERCPFLEFKSFNPPEVEARYREANKDIPAHLEYLEARSSWVQDHCAQMPSPRFLKTHIPLSLLPPALVDTARVVYIARDPRDVAVSNYHFNQLPKNGYIGNFKTFWKYFKNDLLLYTPYFEQLKEAWNVRHRPNVLFLFYEELFKDLPSVVRRVAKFLGKEYTDEQVATLCSHLSIKNFRNNESVHNRLLLVKLGIMKGKTGYGFIDNGKSGRWRDYFDDEMLAEARDWMREQLRGTDLRFPHMTPQELGLDTE